MEIKLTHIDNYHSKIENLNGNYIEIDNKTDKEPKGVSPMELLLMGVAGCSSIDIISILKKQKQNEKKTIVLSRQTIVVTVKADFQKARKRKYDVHKRILTFAKVRKTFALATRPRLTRDTHQQSCTITPASLNVLGKDTPHELIEAFNSPAPCNASSVTLARRSTVTK